jgi:hypothetical protein
LTKSNRFAHSLGPKAQTTSMLPSGPLPLWCWQRALGDRT